ncbi:uncharacterized protein [Lepeophtheirus salmonis]|uniref:Putative LOC100571931 [Acyrthosiphon pisum] n=1 Tax=Lepeophtheirus salmonis TaxID=72036 RepID=A0A0K2VDT0_LEPSM|nr:uncharacterized protein LOC121126088 [Lepeophtheirus salmonis]
MPKKVSALVWIMNNGGHEIWNYLQDEKMMICRICSFTCTFSPPSRIKRHISSSSHIKNLAIYKSHVINDDVDSDDFYSDLTKMLVTCNIPLATVEHPNFSKFVEKYVGKQVPSQKTMTRLVNEVSEDVIAKIKKEVEGKDLFIAVDETKQKQERSISAVMIGPMESYFLTPPYLVNLTDIKLEYANNIADFVTQSIQITLGEDFDESRFKIFITDGTSSSKRAGKDLQRLYPQLEHITCVSEGPNNTAELNDFPPTNNLITELKKTFLKVGRSKRCLITMMETVHSQSSSFLAVDILRDMLIIKWNSKFSDL